jgi:hypothetical protein
VGFSFSKQGGLCPLDGVAVAPHFRGRSPVELFFICLALTVAYTVAAVTYPPLMVQFGLLALMHLFFTGAALLLTVFVRDSDKGDF